MACVALASLIGTIEAEFVQPTPRVRLSLQDPPLIISILETLSSLQAFLQKESSGDDDDGGGALRELEIQIRDFALKAEDDIELQLTNILLAEDWRVYREKASDELHRTLEEAAENATKLLLSCVSEREMASVAVTILIKKFRHYFWRHFPTVYGGDVAAMLSFLRKLSSLRDCLLQGNSISGAAIKKLETKIRIFALKAEHDLEIQLSNFLLAKHTSKEAANSQKLHQTLRKAAEIAAELFQIINKEKEHEKERKRGREVTFDALTSLRRTIDQMEYILSMESLLDKDKDKAGIKSNLLEKLSFLQLSLHKESIGGGGGGGAAMKYLETRIEHFAVKAKYDIYLQLNSLLQAKDTEYEEKVSQELHLTMQEVAESAAELLNIINSRRSNEEADDDEANETQPSNTWLKHFADASKSDGSSSHGFLKPEGRMVGRLHDYRVIKNQLISFQFGLKIISIVGMVGIGKTTLARELYEDPSVLSHFGVRGWVTIPPQHYNKRRILIQLLKSIKLEEPNIVKKGSTPLELQMQVRDCLCGRKYLIVLDNIMSSEAYTDIINLVPNDIAGSFILLTTRHSKKYIYWNKYVHHMTLLDPKESWELFCNVLSIEEHLAPKFEKIRNHVVEKCDGLPQLIVEVAKRLSKCNNIQEGWKKIEKELESLGILDHNAIAVNYNPLPHHLKVCFLYFGVFPKRNRILVKMLIRLWIAEGFVKPLEHKLEDQAYEYLQKLIDESLLLIEDRSCNGKIKICRMHSALHSFCVGEAQKEGILCAVNTQQHSGLSLKAFAHSCRWLSLYSHRFDYYVLFRTNIPRSIFFFHENPEMFVPPKLLRVLAFDNSISLQRVPVQLGGLVFLRYLSITQWFKDLDDVVSNNPNLETLIVSGGNGAPTVHLPSNIWKPPQLKHLELGNSYMVYPPSADKKSLQALSWVVRPVDCRKEVYSKFSNIKNLKILLKDDIETPCHIEGCCSNPIILDHFDYFKWLEKLSISVSIGCNAALPELARFPSGLKKLKLSGINISEGDLNVIAMLPKLKVLKLENAFHETVWNVEEGGFRQLLFLLLEAKELKQWVFNSCVDFLKLRHLVLRSCNCLEQIPRDFSGSYFLKTIELEVCHSSLVASAKQFQQDFGYRNIEIKILGLEYNESQNA